MSRDVESAVTLSDVSACNVWSCRRKSETSRPPRRSCGEIEACGEGGTGRCQSGVGRRTVASLIGGTRPTCCCTFEDGGVGHIIVPPPHCRGSDNRIARNRPTRKHRGTISISGSHLVDVGASAYPRSGECVEVGEAGGVVSRHGMNTRSAENVTNPITIAIETKRSHWVNIVGFERITATLAISARFPASNEVSVIGFKVMIAMYLILKNLGERVSLKQIVVRSVGMSIPN